MIQIKKRALSAYNNLLTTVDWKIAIKTGIVAAIAFAIGTGTSHYMDRPDGLISGAWCVLAAIVVLQANLGGTYKEAYKRFLGILAGSTIGALSTTFMGSDPLSLGISIVFTIIISSILKLRDSTRIACMSAAIVMIFWKMHPEISPWEFAFFRFIDSILGIGIALIIAHTVWPFQITEKMQINMSQILRRLQVLCRLAFPISINSLTENQKLISQLILEIDDLCYQTRLCFGEAKIELLATPDKMENWHALLKDIENLIGQMDFLQKIYQSNPRVVFDNDLTVNENQLINAIIDSLRILSEALSNDKKPEELNNLLLAHENMQSDLSRFRNTQTTRKFNLTVVENFFVFFYTLDAIVLTIQQIHKEIQFFVEKSEE